MTDGLFNNSPQTLILRQPLCHNRQRARPLHWWWYIILSLPYVISPHDMTSSLCWLTMRGVHPPSAGHWLRSGVSSNRAGPGQLPRPPVSWVTDQWKHQGGERGREGGYWHHSNTTVPGVLLHVLMLRRKLLIFNLIRNWNNHQLMVLLLYNWWKDTINRNSIMNFWFSIWVPPRPLGLVVTFWDLDSVTISSLMMIQIADQAVLSFIRPGSCSHSGQMAPHCFQVS